MAKKKIDQPELVMDAPAAITPGQPGDPATAGAELIDDTPDVVKMDLRKFNKAKAKVALAIRNLQAITVITDQLGVDNMTKLLKEASAVGNVIEDKRKDLGDPYRLQWNRINDCAKEIVRDLPGAIKAGKDLILAFLKAQEEKAKQARLTTREKELEVAGMERHIGGAGIILVDHYSDAQSDAFICRYDLESASEELWKQMLIRIGEARTRRLQQTIEGLEKKKETASFFGEEEEIASLQGQIREARVIPVTVPAWNHATAAPATKGLTKRWTYKVSDPLLVPREYLVIDEKKIKEAIAGGTRGIPGLLIFQEESITLR